MAKVTANSIKVITNTTGPDPLSGGAKDGHFVNTRGSSIAIMNKAAEDGTLAVSIGKEKVVSVNVKAGAEPGTTAAALKTALQKAGYKDAWVEGGSSGPAAVQLFPPVKYESPGNLKY